MFNQIVNQMALMTEKPETCFSTPWGGILNTIGSWLFGKGLASLTNGVGPLPFHSSRDPKVYEGSSSQPGSGVSLHGQTRNDNGHGEGLLYSVKFCTWHTKHKFGLGKLQCGGLNVID